MKLQHGDFANAQAIRNSLKRGLARQAFQHAQAANTDIPAIIREVSDLRPNQKALERTARRLGRKRGVIDVRLGCGGRSLSVVVRSAAAVTTCVDGADIFEEEALLYTRISIGCECGNVLFGFLRVSFCMHALERLVERSMISLDTPILRHIDNEARSALRSLVRTELIDDRGDAFISSEHPGVWAGSVDVSQIDESWGLIATERSLPIALFSARTFLSPEEMRPTLWYRWQKETSGRVIQ